ncbi:APC membrane recruitment protein 1 [Lissotriton helveticus]
METCSSNDGRKATIETKPVFCEVSDSGSQAQAAGLLADQAEDPALPPDQPLPGKQKKTSFRFFGVRKSICTLPNFFSSRTKSSGKGALKKSLCKSKTHDCISDVSYGQTRRGPLENISNGETALNSHEHRGSKTLPSSQSAHLGIQAGANLDLNHPRASSWTSTEALDSKPKEDKTLSLPKAKKGLKGLFSGMRRHKKSKAHNSDKDQLELNVLPAGVNKKPRIEPAAPQDINALNPVDNGQVAVLIESPSKKIILSKINKHLDIDVVGKELELNVGAETRSAHKHTVENVTANDSNHVILDAVPACAKFDDGSIPEIIPSDDQDTEPVSTPSEGHMSLLFDDVSSLKSFDSLTGCGDIIADQDIDSIADSTVSVERSRELTKRSSCLVTYQGGGEEMATPDELGDEYLQHLWEKAVEGDASHDRGSDESYLEVQNVSDPAPPLQMEMTPLCAEASVMDAADLTPQSDHQGSAPNSDEGYFDSNTPGPDDDTGDSVSHDFKKDRLPRDSYSGDALYEFYEADDSLMSPPLGGKSLFKNEAYCPELFDHFLDRNFPSDINLMQIIGQQMGAMETEEERLAVIQKQILQWDQNKEPIFKKSEYANQGPCIKQNAECKNRTAALLGRKQRCLNSEQVGSQHSSRTSVNDAFSDSGTEHPSWRDFQELSMPCLSRFYSESSDQRTLSNGHVQITKSGCNFDLDADDVALGTNGHNGSEMHLNARKAHPGSSLSKEPDDGVVDASQDNNLECEQAVSFSQALVDFTSNGTLFSSLSESLGSSDSGSSFTQNLTTLPTMVNFDIVDVENDGEGEFDQQIEISAEEEISASFEDFESIFVQKESFAECDEQMFRMDTQGTLQSCEWGVSSLPRHLSLYRLGSSMPAPLSINRRSRSLDTESLEFELANMRLSKSGLRSCELPVKRGGKKDVLSSELSSSGERAPPFYAEGGEAAAKWLRSLHYNDDLSPEAEERWDMADNGDASVWSSGLHTSVPCESDPQRPDRRLFQGRPENRAASNQSPRQMVRPSNLPLLRNGRQSSEVPGSYQYYADQIQKKLDRELHWEEQKEDCPQFCFPKSSDNVTKKCKPIGITQAMPHFNPNGTETLKHSANFAERYESPQKVMQKGRIEHVKPVPACWTDDCSEYRSNQMLSFTFGSAEGV